MIGNPKSPESRKARLDAIMARRKVAPPPQSKPTRDAARVAEVQGRVAALKSNAAQRRAAPPSAAAPRTTGPMDMPSPTGMRPTATPRGYKKGGMIKGGGKACKTY